MIIENDDNDEAISVECMCVGGKISDSTLKNCRLSRTLTDVYISNPILTYLYRKVVCSSVGYIHADCRKYLHQKKLIPINRQESSYF